MAKIKVAIVTDDALEIMGAFSLYSDAAIFKGKLDKSYSPKGPLPPYHINEIEIDARKFDKLRECWIGTICTATQQILETTKCAEVTENVLDDFLIWKDPGNLYINVKSYISETHCREMLKVALEKYLIERTLTPQMIRTIG